MGIETMNRRQRRMLAGEGRTRPSKLKTGVPAHVQRWKSEALLMKRLKEIKITTLAEAAQRSKMADLERALRAISSNASEVKTMWDLSQQTRPFMKSIKGLGPVSLAALEEYLTNNEVPLKWGKAGA